MRVLTVVRIAAVLLAVAGGIAHAACDFPHPARAKGFRGNLVSAFIICGGPDLPSYGHVPNTTTECGVPACKPPETFHESGGSQPQGWIWWPQGSSGEISMKPAIHSRRSDARAS
jgi:hypothetical protein